MSALGSGDLLELARRRASTPGANEKVLLYLESLPRQSEYVPTTAAPSMFGFHDDNQSRRMTRNGNEHENENEWDVDEPGDSSSYGEVRINNGANGNGYGHIRAEQWGTEAQDRMDAESEHMNESVIPDMNMSDPQTKHYESYESSFGNMGPLPNLEYKPARRNSNNFNPGSRRVPSTPPEDEDDVLTITQDDIEPAKSRSSKAKYGDRALSASSKSQSVGDAPSNTQTGSLSRTSHKSLPKSSSFQNQNSNQNSNPTQNQNQSQNQNPTQRVKSSSSARRSSQQGRAQVPPSLTSNPNYTHLRQSRRTTAPAPDENQPTPLSPTSELNPSEAQLIKDVIASRRTSYALNPEDTTGPGGKLKHGYSHFHDMDLCILLHQVEDPNTHAVVKRALRKAIRGRVKMLGLKHDPESIKEYRNSFHNHDPEVHLQPSYQANNNNNMQEMPEWAKALVAGINRANERFDGLDHKIDLLRPALTPTSGSRHHHQGYSYEAESRTRSRFTAEEDPYGPMSPRTQTVAINTAHPTGYTNAESMYPGQHMHMGRYDDEDRDERFTRALPTDGETRTHGAMTELTRDDSPGQQYLEEELYKLRMRAGGSQAATHKTWELGEATHDFDDEGVEMGGGFDEMGAFTETGMPEIPDGMTDRRDDGMTDRREAELPAIPEDEHEVATTAPRSLVWLGSHHSTVEDPTPPWQRIHQRILNWAVIWPLSEIEHALRSTSRGHQINDIALSIWSTQCYKRYVRSKITDSPRGRPDRLFVPPNMADAISTAVFNGLHGDACGMLKDLWSPFGLQGSPKMILVLAKHRSDMDHWVVHKFSLLEGSLTTYDTYPERSLPDGRPLGWWFAIRAAWPDLVNENAENLTQKVFRLHRPLQLGIDNSVAAGGIWRNLLMGSRAERSLDLERLRDLINTEVKNLRQRKIQGKLSLNTTHRDLS